MTCMSGYMLLAPVQHAAGTYAGLMAAFNGAVHVLATCDVLLKMTQEVAPCAACLLSSGPRLQEAGKQRIGTSVV